MKMANLKDVTQASQEQLHIKEPYMLQQPTKKRWLTKRSVFFKNKTFDIIYVGRHMGPT